jgi:sugar-phosphatase
VLVESNDSVERCWRVWADRVGLGGGDFPTEIHGRTSRATAETLLPPEQVDAATELMEQLEIDDAVTVRPIPGAAALLAAIPADRWAVGTSCSRALFAARMGAAGLALPGIAVTADDVSRSKPHPDGYALALRRLGVDPAHAVVLEDAVPGIQAARAAGVRWVVRVGPGAGPLSEEDAVIPDLTGARWTGRLELSGVTWRRSA